MYVVNGTIVTTKLYRGSVVRSNHHIPTFYLHEDVQGIVSDGQAQTIALDILKTGRDPDENTEYHISVRKVDLL